MPFDGRVESWAEFINHLIDDEARNHALVDSAMKASKMIGTIILCSQVRRCELLVHISHSEGVEHLVLYMDS